MAYKDVVRVDVRCPNHPRFHPERDGPGAVRGGCSHCSTMVDIYAALRKARVLADAKELGRQPRAA